MLQCGKINHSDGICLLQWLYVSLIGFSTYFKGKILCKKILIPLCYQWSVIPFRQILFSMLKSIWNFLAINNKKIVQFEYQTPLHLTEELRHVHVTCVDVCALSRIQGSSADVFFMARSGRTTETKNLRPVERTWDSLCWETLGLCARWLQGSQQTRPQASASWCSIWALDVFLKYMAALLEDQETMWLAPTLRWRKVRVNYQKKVSQSVFFHPEITLNWSIPQKTC